MSTVRTLVLVAAPLGALVSALVGVGALAIGGVLAPTALPTAVRRVVDR